MAGKKKRKYIYTNKSHPQEAIFSVILGAISGISMMIVVYLSYLHEGETIAGYGLTGFLAVVFSLIGFVLSLRSLEQKDIFRFFGVLGLILNLLVLFAVGGIVYMGTVY